MGFIVAATLGIVGAGLMAPKRPAAVP
jgi:hypothetical protein